jgi:hypothetical protein
MGIGDWGLGTGDWGLGIGDWKVEFDHPRAIPSPQFPIPSSSSRYPSYATPPRNTKKPGFWREAGLRPCPFACRPVQAEKLLPQPQEFEALGFSKVKPRLSSPS